MPRVSVIIPAYNASTTLEKAVQSVLDQTMRDLEIIIVEDCSPAPDTWETASALAARHPQVRAIRLPENRGKPHAMNHATRLATGEWIAVLDADDWYAPERLERLLAAAEAAGVEMAADNLMFVDAHANALSGTAFPRRGVDLRLDIDSFLHMSDPTANYDYGMLQPMFRADFIRRHGIDYYEPARIGEDFYQLLNFFLAGGRGIVLDEPLYYYLQPFGSISRQWAQPERKPYDYRLMREIHEHYMGRFGGKLTRDQKRRLQSRGAGIGTMIHFYNFRDALRSRKALLTTRMLLFAPPRFWSLLTRRTLQRVSKMI